MMDVLKPRLLNLSVQSEAFSDKWACHNDIKSLFLSFVKRIKDIIVG